MTATIDNPDVARLTAACPGRVLVLDGIAVLDETSARSVVWMSDWGEWPRLVTAGLLRAEYGGPETYGHVSLFINVPEFDLYGCERGHLHALDDAADGCQS